MKRITHGFRTGFLSPFKGFQLVRTRPRLRRLTLLSFLVTGLAFALGCLVGLPSVVHGLIVLAEQSLIFFGASIGTTSFTLFLWLILLFMIPVGLFVFLYLLFLVSRLLATPLYAMLAEQVLIETGLHQPRPFRTAEWVAISLRLLLVSVAKLGLFMVAGVILFILSLIPAVGLAAGFGFLILAAFDIVDVSLEALEFGLAARMSFFRAQFPAFMGLACALGLVFLVPGLNFLLFPIAIAGGSEIVRIGFELGEANPGRMPTRREVEKT